MVARQPLGLGDRLVNVVDESVGSIAWHQAAVGLMPPVGETPGNGHARLAERRQREPGSPITGRRRMSAAASDRAGDGVISTCPDCRGRRAA